MLDCTHTFVVMEVSDAAFDEIKTQLELASYQHAIHNDAQRGIVLDMHGIAVARKAKEARHES